MDRKTANREWREVTRGAPDGLPTGRTIHAFAQRVEALVIAGADRRLAEQRLAALKTVRRAVIAMAHAAEHDAIYAAAYSELSSVCVDLQA